MLINSNLAAEKQLTKQCSRSRIKSGRGEICVSVSDPIARCSFLRPSVRVLLSRTRKWPAHRQKSTSGSLLFSFSLPLFLSFFLSLSLSRVPRSVPYLSMHPSILHSSFPLPPSVSVPRSSSSFLSFLVFHSSILPRWLSLWQKETVLRGWREGYTTNTATSFSTSSTCVFPAIRSELMKSDLSPRSSRFVPRMDQLEPRMRVKRSMGWILIAP